MSERGTRRLPAASVVVMLLAVAGCSADADPAEEPSATPPDLPGITAGPGGDEPGVDAPSVDPRIGSVTVTGVEDVATALAAPWEAHFLPDGSALVTERDAGRIQRVDRTAVTELTGPGADALAAVVDASGEAGLLGITTLPGDASVVYAYVTRADGNAVVRMELDGDELSAPTDVISGIPKAANHDGGRIAFGPDGHLYIATGDAAQPRLAQERDSLAGKILRVVADGTPADGSVPEGNPFEDLVWSMGHRNVQGLAWLPDGTMVASEFGQSDADELNVIVPGANYGWPEVEGLIGAPDGTELAQTVDGFTYPVAQWQPTSAASPSGIAATEAGVFVAALRGQALFWVPYSTGAGFGEPQTVLDGVGRIRAAVTDHGGELYVLTNNTDGRGSPAPGDDRLMRLDLETGP
ncbi:PQQ-dependent sugar dehydrogenase [Demequina activiva]|uniref:Oxidoreductase n=1 Tax=Demequina activiva TaxID=1582364 RepID=A0A919UID7_9MICO|nr:PQQ-dependent sugar dehydrogenase [Demequina activiva]GIG53291.1 oxidoreductase [Demequina activiva]